MVDNFQHLCKAYKKAAEGHSNAKPVLRFNFYLERELLPTSYACHGQIRFQLKHLVWWVGHFDGELQGLCQSAFLRFLKEPSLATTPRQSSAKNARSAFYQSPLDREIVESKCEFF